MRPQILLGVSINTLPSRVWTDIIAVDASDLSLRGAPENKHIRHVADVLNGLKILPNSPVIEEDWDVDSWRCRTYGERAYVVDLCSIPVEQLNAWGGKFIVHADSICWKKAILVSQF